MLREGGEGRLFNELDWRWRGEELSGEGRGCSVSLVACFRSFCFMHMFPLLAKWRRMRSAGTASAPFMCHVCARRLARLR